MALANSWIPPVSSFQRNFFHQFWYTNENFGRLNSVAINENSTGTEFTFRSLVISPSDHYVVLEDFIGGLLHLFRRFFGSQLQWDRSLLAAFDFLTNCLYWEMHITHRCGDQLFYPRTLHLFYQVNAIYLSDYGRPHRRRSYG